MRRSVLGMKLASRVLSFVASCSVAGTLAYAASNPAIVTTVTSVAALRAIPTAAAPQYYNAYTVGYYAGSTRGAATYTWNASASCSDVGGVCIRPSDSSGNGRWLLVYGNQLNIAWFGSYCDGAHVSADTTAFNNALLQMAADKGGTILLGSQDYCQYTGSMTLPNFGGSGTTAPSQYPMRITTAGAAWSSGQGTAPPAGLTGTIEFQNTTGVAKIVTLGLGRLEVDHLNLISIDTTNGKPFFLTTNTMLMVHDSAIIGAVDFGGTHAEDAFMLGGCDVSCTGVINGLTTSEYQGYGSRSWNLYINKIQRAGYVRAYANGWQFDHNWIERRNGFPAGAMFTLNPGIVSGVPQTLAGVNISDNNAEFSQYKYFIECVAQCITLFIHDNTLADGTGTNTALVRFDDATSVLNYVGPITGPGSGVPVISEATAGHVSTGVYLSIDGNNSPSLFTNLTVSDPSGTFTAKGNAAFVGGSGRTFVQPASGPQGNATELQVLRAANEGVNPGGNAWYVTNQGEMGVGVGGVTWTSNGQVWGFPGVTGGSMTIDTGTGGSLLTTKAAQNTFKDQAGTTFGTWAPAGLNSVGGFSANGVAGVSCSVGTLNPVTAIVTNGLITHC